MSRVVIAGAGSLGHALATRLAASHEVRAVKAAGDLPEPQGALHWFQADLSTVHGAEVALAGAHTVVMLAQARRNAARLQRASFADLDRLMADSVARAAVLAGVKHIVLFECGEDDVRRAILEKSGVPLSVLRGGGPDPLEHLVSMVNGVPGESSLSTASWTGIDAAKSPARWSTCSVQRFLRPPSKTAMDLARDYFAWLPTQFPGVTTSEHGGVFTIRLAGLRALVLRLVPGRSPSDIAFFHIAGGVLAGRSHLESRFEFRTLLDGQTMLATLTGFEPSLPWPLYRLTQAMLHERVMRRFGAWLEAQAAQPS